MDILTVIKQDHEEAKALIKKLESRTKVNSAATESMARELAIAVILHAKSEEEALYRSCENEGKEFLRDFALEGDLEHQLIETSLKKLSLAAPGEDGEFKACLMVVKELIEHHAEEEEEKEMFPKLKRIFSAEERDAMGKEMLAMKDKWKLKVEAMFQGALPGASARKQKHARGIERDFH